MSQRQSIQGSGYGQAVPPPKIVKVPERKSVDTRNPLQKVQGNAGLKPNWTAQMYLQCDKVALQFEKRMILWDAGEGQGSSGFFLWINWDWIHNRPAEMPPDRRGESGWYANLSKIMRLPLLDTSLPPDRLAEWIDTNTMACHAALLERLTLIRREANGKLHLYDRLQKELDATRLPFVTT